MCHAEITALPPLTDKCSCGHMRADHEYGAFGYNAASNCRKEECECLWFEKIDDEVPNDE